MSGDLKSKIEPLRTGSAVQVRFGVGPNLNLSMADEGRVNGICGEYDYFSSPKYGVGLGLCYAGGLSSAKLFASGGPKRSYDTSRLLGEIHEYARGGPLFEEGDHLPFSRRDATIGLYKMSQGEAGSQSSLELQSAVAGGIQFHSGRFFVAPELKFWQGVHPFPARADASRNLAGSPFDLGFLVSLSVGYGDAATVSGPSSLSPDQVVTSLLFMGHEVLKREMESKVLEDAGLARQVFPVRAGAHPGTQEDLRVLQGAAGMLSAAGQSSQNSMMLREPLMIIPVIIKSVAHLGLGAKYQNSNSEIAAFGDLLGVAEALVAHAQGLQSPSSRFQLAADERETQAKRHLVYRSLINSAAFLLGASLKKSSAGEALVGGAQAQQLALNLNPDLTESDILEGSTYSLSYSWLKRGNTGNMGRAGAQVTHHFRASPLYVMGGIETHALSPESVSDELRSRPSKNAVLPTDTYAGLGVEAKPVNNADIALRFGLGAHAIVEYGTALGPNPGGGLHGGATFAIKGVVEVGLQPALERVAGATRRSLRMTIGYTRRF